MNKEDKYRKKKDEKWFQIWSFILAKNDKLDYDHVSFK